MKVVKWCWGRTDAENTMWRYPSWENDKVAEYLSMSRPYLDMILSTSNRATTFKSSLATGLQSLPRISIGCRFPEILTQLFACCHLFQWKMFIPRRATLRLLEWSSVTGGNLQQRLQTFHSASVLVPRKSWSRCWKWQTKRSMKRMWTYGLKPGKRWATMKIRTALQQDFISYVDCSPNTRFSFPR